MAYEVLVKEGLSGDELRDVLYAVYNRHKVVSNKIIPGNGYTVVLIYKVEEDE